MNVDLTMPQAVDAIEGIARAEGRLEQDVYEEKRKEWDLPTSAPWEFLKLFPYA